ncbi:hypothetical protein, partial [Iodobacter sp. BJB302]|uniref:hypothetical protein n=1 Tax=Iodobacter sp. BJB302 TaxID=1506510 RepID=UPI001C55746E
SQIFESNLPNVQLCSPYFMINEKKKLSINYPSFDYKVNSIALGPPFSKGELKQNRLSERYYSLSMGFLRVLCVLRGSGFGFYQRLAMLAAIWS